MDAISVDLLVKSNERKLCPRGQAGLINCCPVKSLTSANEDNMTSWKIWQHLETSLLAWTAMWEWTGATATLTHLRDMIH